ncbi:hypothetical protein HYFRA_00009467 [Hymenoscyphus fraxineus]|uniref:Uncharacterized protein n=1 Tax=Hymenoscyphus fraxineus TaxID=746836 RepID=A0A9N9L0K2_9HELO|nr:hypothetical protein HYFRA_00009467 [Hymenoscyphus fraxineus]
MPPKRISKATAVKCSSKNTKSRAVPASVSSRPSTRASSKLAVQAEEPVSEKLRAAIFTVDSNHLREAVFKLCKKRHDGAVFNAKLEELLLDKKAANDSERRHRRVETVVEVSDNDEDEDADEEDDEEDEDEADSEHWVTCEYCNDEFDLLDNKLEDCLRHPGVKEIDWDGDYWADYDDRSHGDPYSFIDDPDYAEGFIYSCCEQLSDQPGCEPTRHEAAVIVESYKPTAGVKRKVSYYSPVRSSKSRRMR